MVSVDWFLSNDSWWCLRLKWRRTIARWEKWMNLLTPEKDQISIVKPKVATMPSENSELRREFFSFMIRRPKLGASGAIYHSPCQLSVVLLSCDLCVNLQRTWSEGNTFSNRWPTLNILQQDSIWIAGWTEPEVDRGIFLATGRAQNPWKYWGYMEMRGPIWFGQTTPTGTLSVRNCNNWAFDN